MVRPLSDFEIIDARIEKVIKGNKKIPEEFLKNELRRYVNVYNIRSIFERDYNEEFFERALNIVERDYMSYFKRDRYEEIIREEKEKDNSWKKIKFGEWCAPWKYTYAGRNSQIEFFLLENNLEDILRNMGFLVPFNPVREIKRNDIPDNVARYLIGIGYLYPQDEKLIVHPNMLRGQSTDFDGYFYDSPFLTRDLIRCPYHEAKGWNEKPLSDKELWEYWKDLVTLTFGDLRERICYSSYNFRNRKNIITKPKNKIEEDLKNAFNLGEILVPRRYLELKPSVDKFEWVITES